MTYRVYLRWPNQKVTDKTATESKAVAEFAFDELTKRLDVAGALGITFTENGRQLRYHRIEKTNALDHSKLKHD